MSETPDYEEGYNCPLCGSADLEYQTDCPGYTGHDGQVWACSGGSCGNGTVIACNDCDYQHMIEGSIRKKFSDKTPVRID